MRIGEALGTAHHDERCGSRKEDGIQSDYQRCMREAREAERSNSSPTGVPVEKMMVLVIGGKC